MAADTEVETHIAELLAYHEAITYQHTTADILLTAKTSAKAHATRTRELLRDTINSAIIARKAADTLRDLWARAAPPNQFVNPPQSITHDTLRPGEFIALLMQSPDKTDHTQYLFLAKVEKPATRHKRPRDPSIPIEWLQMGHTTAPRTRDSEAQETPPLSDTVVYPPSHILMGYTWKRDNLKTSHLKFLLYRDIPFSTRPDEPATNLYLDWNTYKTIYATFRARCAQLHETAPLQPLRTHKPRPPAPKKRSKRHKPDASMNILLHFDLLQHIPTTPSTNISGPTRGPSPLTDTPHPPRSPGPPHNPHPDAPEATISSEAHTNIHTHTPAPSAQLPH